MNEAGNFIVCSVCWRKGDHKNPPFYGKVVEGGNVSVYREGLNFLISGERFSIQCNKCSTTLYEKLEKEETEIFEERELKVRKFFYSGSILGGTA